jgi:hypothetical protein
LLVTVPPRLWILADRTLAFIERLAADHSGNVTRRLKVDIAPLYPSGRSLSLIAETRSASDLRTTRDRDAAVL